MANMQKGEDNTTMESEQETQSLPYELPALVEEEGNFLDDAPMTPPMVPLDQNLDTETQHDPDNSDLSDNSSLCSERSYTYSCYHGAPRHLGLDKMVLAKDTRVRFVLRGGGGTQMTFSHGKTGNYVFRGMAEVMKSQGLFEDGPSNLEQYTTKTRQPLDNKVLSDDIEVTITSKGKSTHTTCFFKNGNGKNILDSLEDELQKYLK